MPAELYGPLGLLVGLGLAVAALWRDHLRADADDRVQRDIAIAGWREQTAATNRLAAAIEKRNARDAQTHRGADK